MSKERQLEVLSPAGDFERLRTAVQYGADAVYLAGKQFGMRASQANFSEQELKAVSYTHLEVYKRQVHAGGTALPSGW